MIEGQEEEGYGGEVEIGQVGFEETAGGFEEFGLDGEKGGEENGCIVPFNEGVEGDGFGGLRERSEREERSAANEGDLAKEFGRRRKLTVQESTSKVEKTFM